MGVNNVDASEDASNEIYVSEKKYNAVIKIDVNTGNAKYVGLIPNEEVNCENLYWKSINWNSKVFFIPYNAREIAVLDTHTLEIRKIHNTEEMKQLENISYKYSNCFINGNSLIIMPDKIHMIVEVNLMTEKIINTINIEKLKNGSKETHFIGDDIYVKENILYGACWEEPALIEYNLISHNVTKISVQYVNTGFSCMSGVGNKMYMMSQTQEFVVWNIDNKCIEKIEKVDELDLLKVNMRRGTLIEDNVIFLDSGLRKRIKYNISSDELDIGDVFDQSNDGNSEEYRLDDVDGDEIYVYSYSDTYIKYNLKRNSYLYCTKCSLYEDDMYRCYLNIYGAFHNIPMFDMLPALLKALKDNQYEKLKKSNDLEENIGINIYTTLN
jgi:hypothetical protein